MMDDFNIHVDATVHTSATFHELLTSFYLNQHITLLTHVIGYMLDIIQTRIECRVIHDFLTQDAYLSDYLVVSLHPVLLHQLILPSPYLPGINYR